MTRTLITAAVLLLIALPLAASDGATLFKANCATCHGANGGGDTPAGKMLKVKILSSAEVQKLSDAELTKTISDGKGKMRGFKEKMSAADIQALVAHIRTFAHK